MPLTRVNSTQTHPKWQANVWIVIRNLRKHKVLSCILLPKMNLFYKEYGLNLSFESQGSFSSNNFWHVTIYTQSPKWLSE
jgi:hypothetical protein